MEPSNTTPPCPPVKVESAEEINRRRFFEMLCVGLAGLCTLILGLPMVGFVLAPLFRKTPEEWSPVELIIGPGASGNGGGKPSIKMGQVNDFEIGKTINVTFIDPSPLPWAGITSKSAAWLRRTGENTFTAFSVNCTHLGCPIRWLPDAELFMCPCHGGVYYKDGTVAAGPPPRPLSRYEVRINNGQVEIKATAIPITTTI